MLERRGFLAAVAGLFTRLAFGKQAEIKEAIPATAQPRDAQGRWVTEQSVEPYKLVPYVEQIHYEDGSISVSVGAIRIPLRDF